MALQAGIPTVASYNRLVKSEFFLKIETFSNDFLKTNCQYLLDYGRRWVPDPLHQWSRQWEYPFVVDRVSEYINTDRTSHRVSILDAGSGVTFLPYYITSSFENVRVCCCDYNPSFGAVFSKINAQYEAPVEFYPEDIRTLPFKDDSFDIVYCVSVLEHIENFETPIKEFKRVLKRDGMLIVTFDISLDGLSKIPVKEAEELIDTLHGYFTPVHQPKPLSEMLKSEIVTTEYIRKRNRELLPWRRSISTTLKALLGLRRPKFKYLTFYCDSLRNEVDSVSY